MLLKSGYQIGKFWPENYWHSNFQWWPAFLIKARQPIIVLPRTIKVKSKICLSFCIDSLINFLPFIEVKKKEMKIVKKIEQDLLTIDEDLWLFEETL